MRHTLKGKRTFVAVPALGLTLSVALMASQCMAQGPVPQGIAAPQDGVDESFTYQGRLKDSDGQPITDDCGFQFGLWDAAGTGSPPAGGRPVAAVQTKEKTDVADGLFTVELDSGEALDGVARWLQTGGRCRAGRDANMPLTPRQPLTAAPYALSLRPEALVKGAACQNFRVDGYARAGGVPAAIVGTMQLLRYFDRC